MTEAERDILGRACTTCGLTESTIRDVGKCGLRTRLPHEEPCLFHDLTRLPDLPTGAEVRAERDELRAKLDRVSDRDALEQRAGELLKETYSISSKSDLTTRFVAQKAIEAMQLAIAEALE